jgi:hypothetical protein
MNTILKSLVTAALAALLGSAGAMAQSPYYDDLACRQYADAQIAPLRDQANSQTVGSTILGAGLGAALGAVVGGGRGAGIGAASGALVGTGSAPLMRRTPRVTCNSNTTRTMGSVWHPEDRRRRNMSHHHPLTHPLQVAPLSRATRRNRHATEPGSFSSNRVGHCRGQSGSTHDKLGVVCRQNPALPPEPLGGSGLWGV